MINLTEIYVANGTGMFLLLFLLFVRVKSPKKKQLSTNLFLLMVLATFVATLSELIAFVFDGKPGKVNTVILWVSNFFTLTGAPIVSYIWCLFVEYKLHRNIKRLKARAHILAIPVVLAVALCLTDCFFKTNLVFRITEDNIYERGAFIAISFGILVLYFLTSVLNYFLTNASSSERQFFPIGSFLLPCFLGMIVQALAYGIAVGWLGVAIAFVFVYIQLQTRTAYVDELSGLFNRRYMEQYVNGFMPRDKSLSLYGIMIDVNGFKRINDTWGHSMGDDAIITLSNILAESAEAKDAVTRFAGDEFIILSTGKDDSCINDLFDRINKRVDAFNSATPKPYKFSLSMGYGKYRPGEETLDEFLKEIDDAMYVAKEKFYKNHENERRS